MKKKVLFGFIATLVTLMAFVSCQNPISEPSNKEETLKDDSPSPVNPIPPISENPEDEVFGDSETIGPLSMNVFATALAALPKNTVTSPHIIKLASSVIIDTNDTASGVWATINRTVQNAGRYVLLDLSECSAKGNKIDGDYSPSGCRMNIIKSNQYIKGIILPNSLVSIGNWAFYGCTNLTDLTILSNVTSIGSNAFRNCTSLASTTIPSGVTSIGSNAFNNCTSLASVTIPSGVTTIEAHAFEACIALTSVTIPETVTTIENGAFFKCTGLTDVTIPESVTSLGAYSNYATESGGTISYQIKYGAFQKCSALVKLTIPARLTAMFSRKFSEYSNLAVVLTGTGSIQKSAFEGCTELASVTIGDGVDSIGSYAFRDCSGLASVTIGDGVGSIGQLAFMSCSELASIAIGKSVSIFYGYTSSGYASFAGCTSLERVTVDPANETYTSSQGICYNKAQGSVALVPQKISGSITIPEFVTSIGERAFSNCTNLTGINVASANSVYSSINGVLFSKDKKLLIQYPAGHETVYTIPSGVETIGSYSFEGCTRLTSITIPNSRKWPEFVDSFIDIVLPSGNMGIKDVSTVESYVFADCTNLTSVTFGGYAIYDHKDYEMKLLMDIINFFGDDPIDYLLPGWSVFMFPIEIFNLAANNPYGRGFYDNAFPQGSSNSCGNNLKSAYLTGKAGTYTRAAGGSTWTKQ